MRIVYLNNTRDVMYLDCLWMSGYRATPVRETTWGRVKAKFDHG